MMFLTDDQYIDLLRRARARLDGKTKVVAEDSTEIGNKFTASNVGLCDDSLTTKKIAMWPGDFPRRTDMKYLRNRHKCPLDWRPRSNHNLNGCLYTCLLLKKGMNDIEKIKKLYDKLIEEVTNA